MYLLGSILSAIAGALGLNHFGVPAGPLVGAMLGAGAFNLVVDKVLTPSSSVAFAIFASLGWLIGAGITRDALFHIRSALPVIAIVVAALLLFGGLLAYILVRVGSFDAATAYLATSPGGISHMSGLAAATGANVVLVTVLHLTRVIAVVLLAPLVIRLVAE